MGDVKLFRLSGSAAVIDLRTGNNATLRPGLVVLSEDAHTHAIAALEAENAKLSTELERREPAGWKLVPVEPTPAMCAAGFCVSEAEHDPAGVYGAMLAAAPSAPATVQGVNQQLLEALEFAQTFLRHEGRHADDCDIFDLDDEGRHKQCSCNLDALTADLDAAIAAARNEGGKV